MKKILQISFGLIILVIFLLSIGLDKLWSSLTTINLLWILPVFIIFIIVQYFATLNYIALLKSLGVNIDFTYLFKTLMLCQFFGLISPGRIGEFAMVFFLTEKGVNYGKGLAVSLLDELITFAVFSVLALIGIFIFFSLEIFFIVLLFCSLVIFFIIFFILYKRARELIKKYILKDYSHYFKDFSKSFLFMLIHKKRFILLNALITIIKWLISFAGFWLIFMAFDHNVNILYIVFITAIVKIVSLLPISFSGLGLKETSGTYLYNHLLGIDITIAANVMLISTIINYLAAIIFYFLYADLLKIMRR